MRRSKLISRPAGNLTSTSERLARLETKVHVLEANSVNEASLLIKTAAKLEHRFHDLEIRLRWIERFVWMGVGVITFVQVTIRFFWS